MKKPGFIVFALILICVAFMGCKTTKVEERPLWTDAYTVGQVFSSEIYVTGIGKSQTVQTAQSLADGNLASYFARKITSTTSVQQVMSSDDEDGKIREDLVHDISVKSGIEVSGIKHTDPWFDSKEKIYYVCSYLDRKEAWKNYEPVAKQAKNNFWSFLEAAEKESDPFQKIAVLKNAKKAGEEYEEVILFSEILYKQGALSYSEDRKVISSLDEKIASEAMNIVMKVEGETSEDSRYKSVIEKVITGSNFSVSSKNYHYLVTVSVTPNKETYKDTGTIVAVPEYMVEINNSSKTLFKYKKTLDRVTGFLEAEKFLDNKIAKAVESDISGDFADWFKATVK